MSKFDLISRGTLICNPENHSTVNSGTGTLETTGFPTGGPGKAVRVAYPATSSVHGQFTLPSNVAVPTRSNITGLLVEVFNPNDHPMPLHLIMWNQSGQQRAECHMAVDVSSEWQLCWIPVDDWAQSTLDGTSDLVRTIRYQMRSQSDYKHHLPAVAGEYLYFGRAYLNPVQVPVFLLATDDGTAANVVPQTTTNPRKSFLEICQHYGFRATTYIVPTFLGTSANYMTLQQVKELQRAGWSIANHSYSHPQRTSGTPGNPGLRLLGPLGVFEGYTGPGGPPASDDSAIYTELMTGIEWMLANGFPAAHHFTLPQGGWDLDVRSACLRAGLKTIRSGSYYNKGFQIRGAKIVGPTAGMSQGVSAALPGEVYHYTGWIDIPGSVQLDTPTVTQANILSYYTKGKQTGATMSGYAHYKEGLVNFDYLCSLLRTDQDAGLIRVMTIEEYYDATRDWGGRCKFDGSLPSWES